LWISSSTTSIAWRSARNFAWACVRLPDQADFEALLVRELQLGADELVGLL
jgi:hypothetical protein